MINGYKRVGGDKFLMLPTSNPKSYCRLCKRRHRCIGVTSKMILCPHCDVPIEVLGIGA